MIAHTWKDRHVFISQMLLAGVACESPFHVLIGSAWCFHVPQRHLMLLKHHDNLTVFGIRRFGISWACCICWFVWQEKQWFIVMSSTSQVKQKNILIVVMCCHLYTRETIRENLPNFQCKLSLGCSVINQQTVTLALGCIGTLNDCWAKMKRFFLSFLKSDHNTLFSQFSELQVSEVSPK